MEERLKIFIEDLEKATKHLRENSTDLYPVVRTLTDRIEIHFTNKEGESTAILIYDESSSLPPKITTFARLR